MTASVAYGLWAGQPQIPDSSSPKNEEETDDREVSDYGSRTVPSFDDS